VRIPPEWPAACVADMRMRTIRCAAADSRDSRARTTTVRHRKQGCSDGLKPRSISTAPSFVSCSTRPEPRSMGSSTRYDEFISRRTHYWHLARSPLSGVPGTLPRGSTSGVGTLTRRLRLRPDGRRYVHPRRRAAPSLSTTVSASGHESLVQSPIRRRGSRRPGYNRRAMRALAPFALGGTAVRERGR
jgi:hypothetical protein